MDKKSFLGFLNATSIVIISFVLFFFPVIFFPGISEEFVYPKQILIIFSTCLLTIIWTTKLIVAGKVSFLSTPVNLSVGLFGIVLLCSSLFSQNRYDSLFQSVPVVILLLFSFLLINLITKKRDLFIAIYSLSIGGALSALISILYFLHIYILPFSGSNNPLFSTFGSPIQHIGYLLPILFFVGLFVYIRLQEDESEEGTIDSSSVALYFIGLLLVLGVSLNIYKIFFAGERPITLPVQYGIQIATSSLGQDTDRQLPSLLFGSGFGTFLTDFTRFKPISFNLEPEIWNLSISFSTSLILELVATTGILGILTFVYILVRFVRKIPASKTNPLYVSAVIAILFTFLIPYSFTFLFLLFVLISFNMIMMNLEKNKNVYPVNLTLVKPRDGIFALEAFEDKKSPSPALPIMLTAVLIIPLVMASYYSVKFMQSDIYFNKARDPKMLVNGQATYDLLRDAIAIFPYRDDYYRLFSQVNLSLANSITASLKPGEQPSAEMQQAVFSLLQQSVNSARSSIVVAPLTASNWSNLGKIYKSLVGVGQNAEQFATASFQEAIKLNQYDPQNYIDSGGVFYQLGKFDEAIIQFQNAVTLKPDLANAHYNLGHAYESKGDYEKALAEYETVKKLSDQNSESTTVIISEINALKAKKTKVPTDANPPQFERSTNPTEESQDTFKIGGEEVLKIQAPPGEQQPTENNTGEQSTTPTPEPDNN